MHKWLVVLVLLCRLCFSCTYGEYSDGSSCHKCLPGTFNLYNETFSECATLPYMQQLSEQQLVHFTGSVYWLRYKTMVFDDMCLDESVGCVRQPFLLQCSRFCSSNVFVESSKGGASRWIRDEYHPELQNGCDAGYSGPFCSRCDSGPFTGIVQLPISGKCVTCPDRTLLLGFFIIWLIVIVALIFGLYKLDRLLEMLNDTEHENITNFEKYLIILVRIKCTIHFSPCLMFLVNMVFNLDFPVALSPLSIVLCLFNVTSLPWQNLVSNGVWFGVTYLPLVISLIFFRRSKKRTAINFEMFQIHLLCIMLFLPNYNEPICSS
ncbi:hypothetical protein PCE1_003266 [Barthelona sp. PCE]